MKKGFPLPNESSLRKWASTINFNPGPLDIVFNLLDSCSLNSQERACILLADEMKIKNICEYVKRNSFTALKLCPGYNG